MNKELSIAIEELQRRPVDRGWFIPVRFSDCEIPEIPIGFGEYLSSIHMASISDVDFDTGANSIIDAIAPFSHDLNRKSHYLESLKQFVSIRGALSMLASPDTPPATADEIAKRLAHGGDTVCEQCIRMIEKGLASERIVVLLGMLCGCESISKHASSVLEKCESLLQSFPRDVLFRPYYAWGVDEDTYRRVIATVDSNKATVDFSLDLVFSQMIPCSRCHKGELVLIRYREYEVYDGEHFLRDSFVCSVCGATHSREDDI